MALRPEEYDYNAAREHAKSVAETKASSNKKPFLVEEFDREWPGGRFDLTFTKRIMKLHSAVRNPSAPKINPCFASIPDLFDGNYFDDTSRFEGSFGSDGQLKMATHVWPLRYAILFWGRRNEEGTTQLAKFLIDRLVAAIK